MKNPNILLITLLALILQFNTSFAQSYGTANLPEPDNLTPLFIGSLTSSKIYYGATPNNAQDKPVLVFVHGFTDLANLWFLPGNEMYDRAYDGGYRSVFVAMTRGGGMWENGALLANMLEDITDHYNVDDVVIVAHSNGGKASEVAMFHHNKSALVNRVISLGTPFFGTELADLAETFWFRWLVDFIGLGGGTGTSTTYYMGGVARPYLDGQSDNQPDKFFNFGAWGWNSGTTIFVPTMLVTGAILNTYGSGASAGGNDGVTPYWSSTRPGGLPVWNPGYGNPISKHDHIDVAMDYIVWDEIEPYFTGPLGTLRQSLAPNNHKAIVKSNAQYLSSSNKMTQFTIEEGIMDFNINILHIDQDASFNLRDEAGNLIDLNLTQTESMVGAVYASQATVNRLPAGKYQLESEVEFGATINFEKGITMQYSNDLNQEKLSYEAGEKINLNIELLNTSANYSDANVTAIITQKNDIDGQSLSDGITRIIEFANTDINEFDAQIKNLPAGVYNVVVNATHDDFFRTVVTGFAIHPSNNQAELVDIKKPNLQVYPNPIQNQTTVEFQLMSDDKSFLRLYDAYGRLISSKDISNMGIGKHSLNWNIANLQLKAGTYFLEVQNGQYKNVYQLNKVD